MIFLAFRGLLNIAEHQAFSCLSEICDKFASLKIDYPGSGNKSEFVFDGRGTNVEIIEYVSGAITDESLFVVSGSERVEERNSFGNLRKQIFRKGEVIASSNYLYLKDHLGSIREVADVNGKVQTCYSYDPFGQKTVINAGQDSTLQYGGYVFHVRSNLSLTMYRAYSAWLGRWLSRDPIEEDVQMFRYQYVANDPIDLKDPLGLTEHYLDFINCAGYAAREGHYIEPTKGESYEDMFTERGWSCKPKKGDCCCGSEFYTLVVYMYKNLGYGDPWTKPFERGPFGPKTDIHVIRREDEGNWTYQPNESKLPAYPRPYLVEPLLLDPDDYWRKQKQSIPDAYCCCKKKT